MWQLQLGIVGAKGGWECHKERKGKGDERDWRACGSRERGAPRQTALWWWLIRPGKIKFSEGTLPKMSLVSDNKHPTLSLRSSWELLLWRNTWHLLQKTQTCTPSQQIRRDGSGLVNPRWRVSKKHEGKKTRPHIWLRFIFTTLLMLSQDLT